MKNFRIINKIFDKLIDHPWILSFTLALSGILFVWLIVEVLILISSFLLDSNSILKFIMCALTLASSLAIIIRYTMLK